MAPVPTRVEALPEPGEESPGSCRDRVAKAWGSAASVRNTERVSAAFEALSAVHPVPPSCEALPAVLNARASLWRCPWC